MPSSNHLTVTRRGAIESVLGIIGVGITLPLSSYAAGPVKIQEKAKVKITKLETFLVKPRWLFLKIHTDAGVYGLGDFGQPLLAPLQAHRAPADRCCPTALRSDRIHFRA